VFLLRPYSRHTLQDIHRAWHSLRRAIPCDWQPPKKVRVYRDRLDCSLVNALVGITARGARVGDNRCSLGYRQLIENLKLKPQTLIALAFCDELFLWGPYRRTWERLAVSLAQREACKTMIGLLEFAVIDGG
jgi:hypothetical protein